MQYNKHPRPSPKDTCILRVGGIIKPTESPSIPESHIQDFDLINSVDVYNDIAYIDSSDNILDHDLSYPVTSVHLSILYYLNYLEKNNLYNHDEDCILYMGTFPLDHDKWNVLRKYKWCTTLIDTVLYDYIHYVNISNSTLTEHDNLLTKRSKSTKSYLVAYNNMSENQVHFYDNTLWFKLPFVGKSTRLIYGIGIFNCGKVKKTTYDGERLMRNATVHCKAGTAYIPYKNPENMTPYPLYGIFKTHYSTMFMYNLFMELGVKDVLLEMLLLHPEGPG